MPLILRYYKKLKIFTSSKTDIFLIARNEQNIMITTDKNRPEKKSAPLI